MSKDFWLSFRTMCLWWLDRFGNRNRPGVILSLWVPMMYFLIALEYTSANSPTLALKSPIRKNMSRFEVESSIVWIWSYSSSTSVVSSDVVGKYACTIIILQFAVVRRSEISFKPITESTMFLWTNKLVPLLLVLPLSVVKRWYTFAYRIVISVS